MVSLPQGTKAHTGHLLVLAEGLGKGKGQGDPGEPCVGTASAGRVEVTATQEQHRDEGAPRGGGSSVFGSPGAQEGPKNLGNLLSGRDFKAGTAPALPLTRPEVWFYTHPSHRASCRLILRAVHGG